MVSDLALVRQQAAAAERKQDWARAARLRDRVVLQSTRAGFWDRLFASRAVMHAGHIDDAFSRLRLIARVSGTEPAWAMTRAEIEEGRGCDAEALEWWHKAASLQSDPYRALFGLARSLQRLGRADEARQTMARALALPSAERRGVKFAAILDVQSCDLDAANAKLTAFGVVDDERRRTILTGLTGMTSQAERWALCDAARQLQGAGHAVDLGCWLGSLSVSMALGLEANPRVRQSGVRVHAYDAFVWLAAYMNQDWVAGLPMARPIDGESFLPAYQGIVAPWKHLIDIHAGDLTTSRWTGDPIELLSVDAMKSPAVARNIISEFYPSLVPTKAVLFHQDFCHGYTWWIHVYHFLLRDHFEVIDNLEGSAGVVFRFVRPFETGELNRVTHTDLSDKQLAADAFSYSMALVAPQDQGAVAAAYIRCELANGRAERARRLMQKYRHNPVTDRELNGVHEWTQPKSAGAMRS